MNSQPVIAKDRYIVLGDVMTPRQKKAFGQKIIYSSSYADSRLPESERAFSFFLRHWGVRGDSNLEINVHNESGEKSVSFERVNDRDIPFLVESFTALGYEVNELRAKRLPAVQAAQPKRWYHKLGELVDRFFGDYQSNQTNSGRAA